MFRSLILALGILPASSQDHDDHGHEVHSFEWAGIFETPENTYLWTAQKVAGDNVVDYADATMKMAIIPAGSATDETLHSLEEQGDQALEGTCTDKNAGDTITPLAGGCYRLVFRSDIWQSLYTIDASGHNAIAFFTEHFPTEFENTAHYLKDDHGDDIEPVAELPEAEVEADEDKDKAKPWGSAIGVSIIVNFVTLTGVILLVPALSKAAKEYAEEFECLTLGFAAGAISACAFFLLLFEATHLIAEDHKEEVEQIWRWGTMILAGAIFPALMHLVLEIIVKKPDSADKTDSTNLKVEPAAARIVSGILLGDFVHNLCDGFFIGAAFSGCGSTFGWTVAWGTVAHEIAQELSDFVVLTGKDCRVRPWVALVLNFLSGTGVLLGTIIVLSTEVSNGDIGLLLAFGGGTYLYIAFVECMPKVMSADVSPLVRFLGIFAFLLGTVVIGLVLLDHEHCVPPSLDGAEPEAGGHHH